MAHGGIIVLGILFMKRNNRQKNAQTMRYLEKLASVSDKPCKDKRWFNKKIQAKHAALLESIRMAVDLFVYKCPFCRYWHLTSSPPRR